MSRPSDILLGNSAYNFGRQAPMVDLKQGGQMGYTPDYPNYISNASYVRRNLIVRVVEAPVGFKDLPNPDKWFQTLKALIELHPKTIEGLQAQLNVEVQANPFGGAGEEQEDPTNVTRTRSTPTFTWVEKYGRPINAFLDAWIRELIMDPSTKVPNVVTRGVASLQDLLPDYRGMTCIFIEPDPTMTKVDKSWLITNMFPKTAGQVEGRRDLTSAGNTLEYSVEFTGIAQVGLGVNAFAQTILNQMSLAGANPNTRIAAVNAISSAFDQKPGYAEQIVAAAQENKNVPG